MQANRNLTDNQLTALEGRKKRGGGGGGGGGRRGEGGNKRREGTVGEEEDRLLCVHYKSKIFFSPSPFSLPLSLTVWVQALK